MSIDRYTLTFADQAQIETTEFADFLFLFRGAYAAGIQVMDVNSSAAQGLEPAILAEHVRGHLASLDVAAIDSLFREDLGPRGLVTQQMSQSSPLEVVLVGVVVAVAAAAILSGGKLKLLGIFHADLPPIGHGISKLREALARSTRARVGYGIRSRRIKLSREEFDLLMRQDPAQRGRGGFQDFLISFQFRVNRRNRMLDLSEEDMDRIIRHGRDPRKGGWQARIRKIFGNHFDFGDHA